MLPSAADAIPGMPPPFPLGSDSAVVVSVWVGEHRDRVRESIEIRERAGQFSHELLSTQLSQARVSPRVRADADEVVTGAKRRHELGDDA
jgi:hypothetical protein